MPILLADKERCSGCTACEAVCTRRAIIMRADEEGFLYPRIDSDLCIGCGHCEKVCPVLHPQDSRAPLSVYAAQASDDDLRMKSSSGGIFTLLANCVLSHGGVVFGAAFDENWKVVHQGVTTVDELEKLRGSKYVQSDVGRIYGSVAGRLREGMEVLFVGTPCQVAGLKSFCEHAKIDITRLFAVDLVCHATSSPLAWERYLEDRVKRVYPKRVAGGVGKAITRISFRRKNCGWKRYSMSLSFANDIEYLSPLDKDPFLRGFLCEIYNRPSCHNCSCRDLRSGSDLTIADYWNIASRFPHMDDDKGSSLVLVNTDKGIDLFSSISRQIESVVSDYDHAKKINPAIVVSHKRHPNRHMFFAHLRGLGFSRALRIAEIGRRAELKEFYYSSHPRLVNSLPIRVVRWVRRWRRK